MVRNYIRKTDRHMIDPKDIRKAVGLVLVQKMKIRAAAARYNLKKSTLFFHVQKAKNKARGAEDESGIEDSSDTDAGETKSKHASRQIFSFEEEESLARYLCQASAMNFGLTYSNAKSLAFQYAEFLKKDIPVNWHNNKSAGVEWMRSFVKRHPTLSYRKPENVSIGRISGFTKNNVDIFFNNLANVLEKYKFTPDRIVNTDETGIPTVMQAPKVICEKGKKQVSQCVSAERGTLVTFCGIVTATGSAIPPVYIFPRVRMKDDFLLGSVTGAKGYASKNGWITAEIFVNVLRHIRQHTNCSPDHKILLLVDNHETHVSLDAINFCREHGIIMLSFPPHSTHKMQPLDVGIYGPFKTKLKTAFNEFILANPGKPITIYAIAKLTCEPYLLSFTPSNIIKAFQKPGIWPINRLAFDDTDFAGVLQYESGDQKAIDEPEDKSSTPGPSTSSSDLVQRIKIISNEVIVAELIDSILSRVFVEIEMNISVIQELKFEEWNPQVEKLSLKKKQKLEVLSPEVVRPFPKLKRRTENSRCRKRGSSRIYTNTPEKNEIEMKTQNKKKKQCEKVNDVTKNLIGGKTVTKVGAKSGKRKVYSDSEESDDEQLIREMYVDSDIDMDFAEDNLPDGLLDDETVSVGDFVLVRFSTKKKVLYFVGNVQELLDCGEYLVKFLRKRKNCGFCYPSVDDISPIPRQEIISKLPKPQEVKGTARQASYIKFSVSFSNYDVQ